MTSPRPTSLHHTSPAPALTPDALRVPPGTIALGYTRPDVTGAASARPDLITMDDSLLAHHMLISGSTGTGKSHLMAQIALGVIRAGRPVVVIDTHGSLNDLIAMSVIDHCPVRRDDLVVIDLRDTEYPVSLNPLDVHSRAELDFAVAACVETMAIQMGIAGAVGPRAMNYARMGLSALAEANLALPDGGVKCTLDDLASFMMNPSLRSAVMRHCTNPSIQDLFGEGGVFALLYDDSRRGHVRPIVRMRDGNGQFSLGSDHLHVARGAVNWQELLAGNAITLISTPRDYTGGRVDGFLEPLLLNLIIRAVEDASASGAAPARILIDGAPKMLPVRLPFAEQLSRLETCGAGLVLSSMSPRHFAEPTRDVIYEHVHNRLVLPHVADTTGALPIVMRTEGGPLTAEDLTDHSTRHAGWIQLHEPDAPMGTPQHALPIVLPEPLYANDVALSGNDALCELKLHWRDKLSLRKSAVAVERDDHRDKLIAALNTLT